MIDSPEEISEETSKPAAGFLGLVTKFFHSLLQESRLRRGEKRRRKTLTAKLKNNSSKYFRIKGQLALPALAEWFYAIFKVMGPALPKIERYSASDLLTRLFIESFLPQEVLSVIKDLHPDSIMAKRNKGGAIDKIVKEVRGNLALFREDSDSIDADRINKLYTAFHILQDFSRFPFHSLLKKFDSAFPDQTLAYTPNFSPVEGKYIIDDLEDFICVFYTLNENIEWDILFKIFKKYRDENVILPESWGKLLQSRRSMMKSQTLELIVRYIRDNHQWKPKLPKRQDEIVSEYIKGVITNAEHTVETIVTEERARRIESMQLDLFGEQPIVHNENYSEEQRLKLQKKNVKGCIFAQPLDYLKTFCLSVLEEKIRKVTEILLLHGKWTISPGSQLLSEPFTQLVNISKRIAHFDSKLSSNGDMGLKIRLLTRKISHDPLSITSLKTIIQRMDDEAKEILDEAILNFTLLAEAFKQLNDEYNSPGPKLILNWKRIHSMTREPFNQRIFDIYKKIDGLLTLLRFCMDKQTSSSGPAPISGK